MSTPNPFTDEREAILDALVGQYNDKTPYVPDRIIPPAAFVTFAGATREDSDTAATLTTHYELWLVKSQGPNKEITNDLDADIFAEAVALRREGFGIESIAEPMNYEVQGGVYFSTIIRVTSGVDLT